MIQDMLFVPMFLLGLGVGSFLNVVIYRTNTGEGVVSKRSRCFACGITLGWQELIPLASFFYQRGRCIHCGSRISWQYSIVEFLTGLVFVLASIKILMFNDSILTLFYFLVIFSILIAISAYDLRHKIIPNQLVYPFIALTFVFRVFDLEIGNLETFSYLLAGFFAFSFFALLWLISKGTWMGFGDAKLAAGIGFFLGPSLTPLAVILSFWLGALVGTVLLLSRRATRKSEIPFAPFLAAGAFLSWLLGDYILSWYFSTMIMLR